MVGLEPLCSVERRPDVQVAIAPRRALSVGLTRHEVMRGPRIDSDMPVSGKYEEASAGFYGRSLSPDKHSAADLRKAKREARRPHLTSSNEVIGYSVHGLDGLLGHADDLLVDDDSWRVTTPLVDEVRVSPVRAVDWKTREICLNVRRGEVQPSAVKLRRQHPRHSCNALGTML